VGSNNPISAAPATVPRPPLIALTVGDTNEPTAPASMLPTCGPPNPTM
jgi:hypothetical protein